MTLDVTRLRFDDHGLIPVVVQELVSGAVLMLAYADREAVEKTLATGEAHFWSRSRQAPWHKGETSGNLLKVVEVIADCDQDALLLRVRPTGPTCHTGNRSCFEPNAATLELGWLAAYLETRQHADPESSWTARLLSEGIGRVAQKVGEEAVETVVASLAGSKDELAAESADLLYHLLVLLLAAKVEPGKVAQTLLARHRGALPGEVP
jgi:phosphoribosyl-ATP pyrophosphohydrolase/phosphoribosyl-AMP cyclohydrolase